MDALQLYSLIVCDGVFVVCVVCGVWCVVCAELLAKKNPVKGLVLVHVEG